MIVAVDAEFMTWLEARADGKDDGEHWRVEIQRLSGEWWRVEMTLATEEGRVSLSGKGRTLSGAIVEAQAKHDAYKHACPTCHGTGKRPA